MFHIKSISCFLTLFTFYFSHFLLA